MQSKVARDGENSNIVYTVNTHSLFHGVQCTLYIHYIHGAGGKKSLLIHVVHTCIYTYILRAAGEMR